LATIRLVVLCKRDRSVAARLANRQLAGLVTLIYWKLASAAPGATMTLQTTGGIDDMCHMFYRRLRSAALLGLLAVGISSGARAQEAFGGPWPWAEKGIASDAEASRLLNQPVSILPTSIDGPKPLLCRKLKYKVTSYAPDMLFQGSLTAPDRQARALGFKNSSIKTLETGCEAGIDFHMVDDMTVLFGLNDRVYTMTRRK